MHSQIRDPRGALAVEENTHLEDALIILRSGTQLSREDIVHYVRNTVDLFVQLERQGGRRMIRAIVDQADI